MIERKRSQLSPPLIDPRSMLKDLLKDGEKENNMPLY